MGGSSSRARASQVDFVKDKISSVPVVVFSKTYCPYCTKAKAALNQLGAKYETVELDVVANGSAIQKALADITGRRSVPNVFVSGESIGGGDETAALAQSGQLKPLLEAASAL